MRRDGRQEVVAPDSTGEAGELDRKDPVEGSAASSDNTVGGKHDGDTELWERVNATTTDSEAGETKPADGVHFAEPLP